MKRIVIAERTADPGIERWYGTTKSIDDDIFVVKLSQICFVFAFFISIPEAIV